jgi:hypothetical protein
VPTSTPHRPTSIVPHSAVSASHKRKTPRVTVESTFGHIIFVCIITLRNRGPAAGVYWDGGKYKWAASLTTASDGGGRAVHLGWFVDEMEAALAYDQAACTFHGDEAQLNFSHLAPLPEEPCLSREPRHSSQPSQRPTHKKVRACRSDQRKWIRLHLLSILLCPQSPPPSPSPVASSRGRGYRGPYVDEEGLWARPTRHRKGRKTSRYLGRCFHDL